MKVPCANADPWSIIYIGYTVNPPYSDLICLQNCFTCSAPFMPGFLFSLMALYKVFPLSRILFFSTILLGSFYSFHAVIQRLPLQWGLTACYSENLGVWQVFFCAPTGPVHAFVATQSLLFDFCWCVGLVSFILCQSGWAAVISNSKNLSSLRQQSSFLVHMGSQLLFLLSVVLRIKPKVSSMLGKDST